MKKTDLLKLSVGNIGNAWGFMMIFLFLPLHLKSTVFSGHPLADVLGYSVITISFTAGALTYLFAGYISDKKITRLGKRRPYFLLVIPAGIAYVFLGFVPPISSEISFFIYYSVVATIFAVLDRIQYCNFWALYMDKTDPDERVRTSVVFNLFGLVGTVGALFLTPILETFMTFNTIILIVGAVYIGTVLFAFFVGPKEDLENLQLYEAKSLLSTLKETVKERNFLTYLFATLFFVMGYSMSVLVLTDFLDVFSIELLHMLAALFPIAIFYFYLLNRLAKTKGRLPTFRIAILFGIVTIPSCIFLLINTSGSLFFVQALIIIAIILFVVISTLTFQYALLMDLTPTGKEATYSSLFLFMIVIPIPLSSALVGPIRNFLAIDALIWEGDAFSFAIIFLITTAFLIVSYFLLRTIRIKEEKSRSQENL